MKESEPFISIGSIGFSVGSNIHLLNYLLYIIVSGKKQELINYTLPEECALLTGLTYAAKQHLREQSQIARYFYIDLCGQLKQIHRSGGCNYMNNVVENYLSQEFGLQTGKNLQTYGNLYPNQRLLGICSHGAQYISAKIEEKLPKSNNKEINEIIKGDRPIALIANRDSYWVGNGQAWRDSKINEFIPTIEYLLGKGYSVIRINSYSEPLQYASPFYLDFSGNRDLTANDQILVARKASILVGGDTGIVGVCQMLSHLPTLLVNGADWRPHVPWGNVILAPKHLEIKDKSKIRSLETGNILEFIFRSKSMVI